MTSCKKYFKDKYCKPANLHRGYTIELISAISKPLKNTGRLLMMYFSLSPLVVNHLGKSQRIS
jgi:hypothetical protein